MDVVAISNISCNGGSDGSVTLAFPFHPVAGTPDYTLTGMERNFISSPLNLPFTGGGSPTVTVNNLDAAHYRFTAVDANGCNITATVTLDEPTKVIADVVFTEDALCNGSFDGRATVIANYAWSSGAATVTATGLAADTYFVTITDAEGCTAIASATIGQPDALNAFVNLTTNVSCNGGSDGNIHIGTNGGTSPYKYQWDGFIPADNVQDALNIPAGTYTVTVTDANQCSTVIGPINISEPSPVSVTIGSVVNADCAGNETGSAIATASGGTGAIYNFAWSNGQNGTNQATATGLHAGGYSVTVTDENGCTAQASTFISDPSAAEALVTATNDVSCNGGNDGDFQIQIISGTGTPPYSIVRYVRDGFFATNVNIPLQFNGSATFANVTNLQAGHYGFRIQDGNGCYSFAEGDILEPTLLIAEIIHQEDESCPDADDGTVTVNATGGTTGYTYLWSASAGSQITNTATCY